MPSARKKTLLEKFVLKNSHDKTFFLPIAICHQQQFQDILEFFFVCKLLL